MNTVKWEYSQFTFNMTLDEADDDGAAVGGCALEGEFYLRTIFGLIEFIHE